VAIPNRMANALKFTLARPNGIYLANEGSLGIGDRGDAFRSKADRSADKTSQVNARF